MSFNKKQVDSFFSRTGFNIEKGRETMDALRSQFAKLKKQIQPSNNFEPSDEIHIITIVMCQEIQMRAFADIIENGLMIYVDAAKSVKQKNHSISTFYQMSKMINDTSRKLGLSALDRMELKLQPEDNDGMNDDEDSPKPKKLN
jgi:phage terminase small subunit